MSYKYFYRIKYERWNEQTREWHVGSMTEQFRNEPLHSREFNYIRWHIFNEMDIFNVAAVRACIYRISALDDYRIGEFDGTENDENRDYDRICGCYIPLVGIVHIAKSCYCTHYWWYDCGVPFRGQFHGHTTFKEI